MDQTRKRNLIWLASTRSKNGRGGETNLAAAWDVAVAQMAAARRAGDAAAAAGWEAKANSLYVQITGRPPDDEAFSPKTDRGRRAATAPRSGRRGRGARPG